MYHFRRPQYKRNQPRFKQVWVPIQRSPSVPNTMDSFNLTTEEDSWSADELNVKLKGTCVSLRNLELTEEAATNQEENLITMDILPDEMHEKILSCLPLSAIFKASRVCKNWNHIIYSMKIRNNATFWSETWYFMFTSPVKPVGYLYDSGMRKWYNYKLPFMVYPSWSIAPSRGLVCFMDDVTNRETYICNPITRDYIAIKNPPCPGLPQSSALAFSVDQSESKYTISIVRSMEASNDFSLWDFSIHVYNSNDKIWLPPVMGTIQGWKPADVSVICDNILYILVLRYRNMHGVITYNLDNTEPWIGVLNYESVISLPCALTYGRVMNVQKKLVLVGIIETPEDRPWKIEDVRVWVLDGRVWTEVTRMPREYVQGLGKLGHVFASTGNGNMIYIQSYRGTALVVFDMDARQWFWSRKCLMHKKFPSQIPSGFCFEPVLLQQLI